MPVAHVVALSSNEISVGIYVTYLKCVGVILPSDSKKSRPQNYSAMAFLGLSFYRKSKTSCENSENIVKTSETREITEISTIVDSNVDNMEPNILDISHISLPETVTDEIIENPNLSAMIDPDVFETSILSESGKGKLTNGQLVKNISMKDCLNVESAIEADSKSVKGKKRALEADS